MAAPHRSSGSIFAALCYMARSLGMPTAFLKAVLLLQFFTATAIIASGSTLAHSGLIAHPMALGASATQNNITITQNFSSVYYVDTKTSPFPTGFYAAYNVTNNSSSDLADVWVTLGNFTGSTVYLSLGGNDTGVAHLGLLAAGASKAAYFYLSVDCSSFTAGNCNISAAQGVTVDVYLGPPTDNLLASLTTNDITVFDTIAASANKVNTGSVSTTSPFLGTTFTVTVNGSTGTIGGSNIFALSPETSPSFPADSFQLISTSLTFSNGGSGTFTDLLQIPTSVMAGISSANYAVTYTYRVTGTTSTTTTAQPLGYINSGAQVKHTTISSLGSIPPIQPATNPLLLTMTVSPTSLGLSGGTVTYTVHVTNDCADDATLDEFIDALASSPNAENYVTGSSKFAGSPINDPTIIGSTLTWSGTFTIPGNGEADLIFQTTIPGTVGTYTDFAYGLISASQIDTTFTTVDDAEATTSVTVSAKQNTTISISNIPSSATYGGSFVPSYAYTGDGTASVSSNSTSVCTVTSGVVHYVGVGTCSLTASATAGTNYNAVTGTAQTFSVGQATPTISISNLPASGTYGSSFTPTFSYTGDGTTSVSSNSTSVCTVTSGVVHYVGVGTCSLTASATAGTNYTAVTGTAQTFSVGQATPTISISNLPASGTYGGSFTPTFSYTGDGTTSVSSNSTSVCTVTSGVVHYVGVGTCSLTASATAGTNYTAVTGTAQTFSVGKATAIVTLGSLSQTYTGLPLSATAATNPSGLTVVITYNGGSTPPTAAGAYTVVATVNDSNYQGTVTGTLTIAQVQPTITWSTPSAITYGTALSGTQLNATSGVAGTFAYTPAAGTVLDAGANQTLSVTFTPTDATDYTSATQAVQITVNKAMPTITWATPSAITYGTALNGTQLKATAEIAGTFVYTPAAGTVLNAGANQTLSVAFTPTNTTDYASATQTVQITVNKAAPTATLASSINPADAQSPITFTATVSSTVATPTGNVNFVDGTTFLGSGALSNGVANFSTSSLATGTHSVTAVYGGDASFSATSSPVLSEVVVDFGVSSVGGGNGNGGSSGNGGGNGNGGSQTVSPGGTANFTIAITPTAGTTFPTITYLTVSGLPSGATATLATPGWTQLTSTSWSLPAFAELGDVSLSFKVPPSQSADVGGHPAFSDPLPPAFGALLLLPLLMLPFAIKLRRSVKPVRWVTSAVLFATMSLSTMVGLIGCGGHNGFFGQQQQSYVVTITVTTGNLSRSTNVTLTVE